MIHSSLRTRIITLLALSLLPAFVFAVVETVRSYFNAQRLAERNAVADILLSVESERSMLIEARRTIATIAILPGIVDGDPQACQLTVSRIYDNRPIYSRLAVMRSDGSTLCSAPALPAGAAPQYSAIVTAMNADPTFFVTGQAGQAASGSQDVAVVTPTFNQRGAYIGPIVASLRVDWFDRLVQSPPDSSMTHLALVNRDGKVITQANVAGAAIGELPAGEVTRQHFGRMINFFSTRGQAGPAIRYAVAPLLDDDVYLLAGTQQSKWQLAIWWGLVLAILAPLAMYALALCVAWYAVDRLVIRHINRLRLFVTGVENGAAEERASLEGGAPTEIVDLVTHMNAMLDSLDDREQALKSALVEQQSLTKEIYHRVRNNLQIISSLMNLQLRGADSESARKALVAAQKRIQAMATVQEQLYRDNEVSRVKLDTLLRNLTRTIQGGFDDQAAPAAARTEIEIAPVTTDPDLAIPLALLYTEALTNALESSSRATDDGVVQIRLTEYEPGMLHLEIANPRSTGAARDSGAGLGLKLINALARQLRGTLSTVHNDVYKVDLRFPNAESTT